MPLNCFTIYNLHSTESVCLCPDLHTLHTRLSASRRSHQKNVRIFVGCLPSIRGGGGGGEGAGDVLILDLINSSALPNEMEGYLSDGARRRGGRQSKLLVTWS